MPAQLGPAMWCVETAVKTLLQHSLSSQGTNAGLTAVSVTKFTSFGAVRQADARESSRDGYWHTLKWRDPSPDTTKLSVVKQQRRNVKAFDLNTGLHGILQIHAWKLHRVYINSEYQSHND